MSTVWVIRAGGVEQQNFALENNCVVIGFRWLQKSIAEYSSVKEMTEDCRDKTGETSNQKIAKKVRQPYYFANTIKKDDWVILPCKNDYGIASGYSAVGKIAGEYEYSKSAPDGCQHQRKVKWKNKELSNGHIPHSLTNFSTVSKIKDGEMYNKLTGIVGDEVVLENVTDDTIDKPKDIDDPKEFIMQNFQGDKLSSIISAILDAMGYDCTETPKSHDGGIDILARHKDIVDSLAVQVKHHKNQMGSPNLQQFLGAMKEKNIQKGIFVSWGGFGTNDNEEKLKEKHFANIRLWNADDIMRFIDKHYESFSDELKKDFPLKRILVVDNSDE